jgi:hypothetical protein
VSSFYADRVPAETDLLDERGVHASEEGFDVRTGVKLKAFAVDREDRGRGHRVLIVKEVPVDEENEKGR